MVGGTEVFSLLVVKRLGESNTTLGLINGLLSLSVLSMLVAAPRVEAIREKRRLLLGVGVLTRVPHLLVAAALLLLAPRSPGLCVLAIAVLLLFKRAAGSLQGPPWADLVAETIPPARTGFLFGLRTFLSSVLGLVAAFASGAILASLAFPGNYAVLYAVAFCLVMVSWVAFTQVDEVPEDVSPPERRPALRYFLDLVTALRTDRSYRNLLRYRGAAQHRPRRRTVLRRGGGRLPRHERRRRRPLPDRGAAVGRHSGAAGGTAAGAPHRPQARDADWGRAGLRGRADGGHRAGRRAHALRGRRLRRRAGSTLVAPSHMAFTLRIYPRGRRVGYGTVAGLVLVPVTALAAWRAGHIMDGLGHTALFALAAAASLAALLPLGRCSEPPQEGHGVDAVD